MITLFKIVIVTTALINSSFVFAQRGETLEARPSIFNTPTTGYPGFFDTNMAKEGDVVVEWPPIIFPMIPMPSIAVDYGVNERLTVGTNALLTLVPWALGMKSVTLKARTLLYGNETMQSAISGYLGYFSQAGGTSTYWQILSTNNAWKLSPNHIFAANAAFINFGLEDEDLTKTEYANVHLTTATIGGGHQYIWSDTTSISTYLMLPISTAIQVDSAAIALDLNGNLSQGAPMWVLARMSLDLRSDPWVYSFGAYYTSGVAKELLLGTSGVVPWFSATRRY